MKKVLLALVLILSVYSYSDFIDEMQKIDKLIQSKSYDKAYDKANQLLNSDISKDDKNSVIAVMQEIENKKKTVEANNTNATITDLITQALDENTELSAANDGTTQALPTESISDASKFNQYKSYENQVVSTNNADAIYSLALLYIKDGLYESAMNLALKDKTHNPKNLYLAATTARFIGKYDTAINNYQKVLKVNSNHAKSYLGLAMAYKGKGNYKTALKYLNTYASYDNSDAVRKEIAILNSL